MVICRLYRRIATGSLMIMLSEKHRGNLTGHWSFYTCRLVHFYGITTVSRIRFIVSCGMEGYDIRLLPREFPTNHVVINDIMADRAVEVAMGIYFHGNHGNLSHCERPNHGNYFLCKLKNIDNDMTMPFFTKHAWMCTKAGPWLFDDHYRSE